MSDVVLLYTTWPERASAQAAGRAVVEAGLCACANLLAPMTSIYRWQGAVHQAEETPMLVKTTAVAAAAARALLISLHPYHLPAIVALAVDQDASSPDFLKWIVEESAAP